MLKTDVDPLDAYRRARFWFAVFVLTNLETAFWLHHIFLVWWPLMIFAFHLGRMEASV